MRTTLTLDADVHELASVYAAARGITLGAAVGELIRQGQSPDKRAASKEFRISSAGLPVFPKNGRIITSEMVKQALEDDLG